MAVFDKFHCFKCTHCKFVTDEDCNGEVLVEHRIYHSVKYPYQESLQTSWKTAKEGGGGGGGGGGGEEIFPLQWTKGVLQQINV